MFFIHGTFWGQMNRGRGTVMFCFGVHFVHSRDLLILVDAGDVHGEVNGAV